MLEQRSWKQAYSRLVCFDEADENLYDQFHKLNTFSNTARNFKRNNDIK